VIGGVAAYLLGSDLPSANLDICFADSAENIRQLALALNDLHAQSVGSPRGVAEFVDENTLRNDDVLTFRTERGVLRCIRKPAGTRGYGDLRERAESMEIDGVQTNVADLADLIRMKEAFDREKDRLALLRLRALQKLSK